MPLKGIFRKMFDENILIDQVFPIECFTIDDMDFSMHPFGDFVDSTEMSAINRIFETDFDEDEEVSANELLMELDKGWVICGTVRPQESNGTCLAGFRYVVSAYSDTYENALQKFYEECVKLSHKCVEE